MKVITGSSYTSSYLIKESSQNWLIYLGECSSFLINDVDFSEVDFFITIYSSLFLFALLSFCSINLLSYKEFNSPFENRISFTLYLISKCLMNSSYQALLALNWISLNNYIAFSFNWALLTLFSYSIDVSKTQSHNIYSALILSFFLPQPGLRFTPIVNHLLRFFIEVLYSSESFWKFSS